MSMRTVGRMDELVPVRIVLSDANVLYSRVLRDYLLYAATRQIISVAWSEPILEEMAEHLQANVDGFTVESGRVLVRLMNEHFPYALTDITDEADAAVADLVLPDEEDRHVLAAAVAAEADVLCTSNLKDFPSDTVGRLGLQVQHPDELLAGLVESHPEDMREVHRHSVAGLRGATDESTIAALKRADAPRTADLISVLLTSRIGGLGASETVNAG
jgi:predicted nucleic acid-binding protein